MSIVPSKTELNKWLIRFSIRVDGELKFVNEEFEGNIKDAMSYERQLRSSATDGSYFSRPEQTPLSSSISA